MKEFMSYLIIIAIIAFIGFICYMIVRRSNGKTGPLFPGIQTPNVPPQPVQPVQPVPSTQTPPVPPAPGGDPQQEEDPDGEVTGIFTEWAVVQLDPRRGTPVKRQNLIVPEKGKFTVGRNKGCNFVLEGATAEDYVSRFHLGVGKDDNGYFAKPLSRSDGSAALTYIDGELVMGSFDLENRKVIWLGKIPIAFVRNQDLRRDLQFIPDSQRDDESLEQDLENTMTFSKNKKDQNRSENVFSR